MSAKVLYQTASPCLPAAATAGFATWTILVK
jgi:hypothetical protein